MKKKILVVEDNEFNRELLVEILSEEYEAIQAGNGQEALDILEKHSDIALILLDVVMPVMDGYSFLEKRKESETLSLIPVIVMTHGDSEKEEVDALSAGATDFVPKPYRPRVILHRIASLIKLRESAALINQFMFDRLTGLYSKEYFYKEVRERLDQYEDREYSLICSNIENFKLYNATFGREKGDELLRSVAQEAVNMMGETGICARYSADRFMCLLEREHEFKIRELFRDGKRKTDSEVTKNLSFKWGVYEITDRNLPVDEMCDRAMLAVESIKGQYNRMVAIYDDDLRNKIVYEKTITDMMEEGLENEQFTVYLQPKYSIKDNSMVGAEALVRWIHPERGFMSPGEFLPIFEKNGFISKLDAYVWEKTCKLLSDWRAKGLSVPAVSVNMSRADIYQHNLVEMITGFTKKYNINPSYIHIEITESAFSDNESLLISTIGELRRAGFVIEMDDFGSGYSSLNMISRVDFDILKLDGVLIRNEMNKLDSQTILNDIIHMAHRLHMSVVAEGVETREQVNRLRLLGCDYVQGYYFAKPMPAAEFEEFLRTEQVIDVGDEENDELPEVQSLLIVDDDILFRENVRRIFDGSYGLIFADNEEEALKLLEKHNPQSVGAVLISMTLPGGHTEKFMKKLHVDPKYYQIPVLAVVPGGNEIDRFPLALEADDFICKCHPGFDFRKRVDRLIETVFTNRIMLALQEEACRDYLTGIYNRKGFYTALTSLRKEDRPVAIYLFDIDNLKQVNDKYGHDMGDRMLRTFADVLRKCTRNGDILCRYGGDEFAVVLKAIEDEDIVLTKGERVCSEFAQCFDDGDIAFGCSGGIVISYDMSEPIDELISKADRALYLSKAENKGRCRLWRNENINEKEK